MTDEAGGPEGVRGRATLCLTVRDLSYLKWAVELSLIAVEVGPSNRKQGERLVERVGQALERAEAVRR